MDAIAGVTLAMDAVETAWAAGDPRTFAELHTATASYVAFDGSVMVGREEILAGHEPLFRGIMRGSRLLSWDRQVRLVAPDVAVATQKGGIVMRWQGDRPIPSAKRVSTNTTVLVRSDDAWMIDAFQNTRYNPWALTLMGRLMSRST